MGDFDVAICVDQGTLDRSLAALYSRPALRSQLFSGSQAAPIDGGASITISYDVQQPPTTSLNAPSPDQWQRAIKGDGEAAAQPVPGSFVVHFQQVKLVRPTEAGGAPQETTTAFDAICTAAISDGLLVISPLAVVVDLSTATPLDRILYKKVIIPRVLAIVGATLSGHAMPQLNFQGFRFGPAVIAIGNGILAACANLLGKPTPSAPAVAGLPTGRFSVLLGAEAMQQVANQGTQGLQGRNVGTQGSSDFGIGRANYEANVRLDAVTVAVSPDPTVITAVVTPGISASAGVDVFEVIWDKVKDAFSHY